MPDDRLTAVEAATLVGVAASTWRSYVARGQAPAPVGYSPSSGRRVWDAEVVRAWCAARPGRGNWRP